MAITQFDGPYRWLSNFAPVPHGIKIRVGVTIMTVETVEHAFQAIKTNVLAQRAKVAKANTPGEAKRLGRQVPLRPDWDAVRIAEMRELLKQKFAPGTFLAEQLLGTGNEELVEGNYWHDTFWGVCNGVGENHLGKLLMEIRRELRGGHEAYG